MNAEEAVVYNALAGEVSVTSLLPSYSGQPSIFAGEAPQDAVLPFVVFNTVSVTPWDGYVYTGFDSMVDIRCYSERTRSLVALNNLAMACRTALHRQRPVPTDGKEFVGTWAIGGPSELPIEERTVGRVITLRIISYLPE